MRIGLAWLTLTPEPGKSIVWHNGGTGGYRSWLGFNPATNRGAIVFTNQSLGVDEIGFRVLTDPTLMK